MLQITRVRKIGNSLGVLIPAEAAKTCGFADGTRVLLQADRDRMTVEAMTPGMEDTLAHFDRLCGRFDGVLRELGRE